MPATLDIHLVRLAVFEVEDLADALRTSARSPISNAQRYNAAMHGARWLEKRIEGRDRIQPVDIPLGGRDWNKLAELCANSGMARIARKIWSQLEMGD